ncbi:MAG: hypothetical protein IPO40_16955 [Fibrobacteres bacterium]|nr:hypothetical protein [Fibrobacterota bacterium]
MRMERFCQNLLLAALVAGLAACESNKDVVGMTSSEGISMKPLGVDTAGLLSSHLVGKWAFSDSGDVGRLKWQVEMQEDGLYVTCDLYHRFYGTRVDTVKSFACDSGTWSDLGKVTLAYDDLVTVLANPARDSAMLNASRLVMVKWKHPVDPLRPRFDHPSGLLFSRSGDSLVNVGSFEIFQGGAGRRLDSTLWCQPGGMIDSLFLGSQRIAKARVQGISGMTGAWVGDSTSLDISFPMDKAPDGSFTRSVRIGGRVGFLGSHLILLDLEDPTRFRKVADEAR